MLSELHVRDLGVVADVRVELGPGMTALTGETGAGKTLLVQALSLVLGGRGSSGLVRRGADEALVEARFLLEGHEEDERTIARAIPASGRSRAWVDGRMAPVAALGDATAGLVDVHGQHDQQTLLTTAGQRAALDQFASADLAPLAAARTALGAIVERLGALGGDARERAREMDLLDYQVAEIDAAHLEDPDEEAALEAEEERLADAAALRVAAAAAYGALAGDERADALGGGARGLVGTAQAALSGRRALEEMEGRLHDLAAELDDVASTLRAAAESFDEDPGRLAEVQARRHLLADLRRKYGETITDVVAFADTARAARAELARKEEEAASLERRLEQARTALAREEAALRVVRAEAAPRLGAAVTDRLQRLAMADARIEVVVGEDGAGDAVTFLMAANPGEPPQPLARVASGGELSRTMLALRLVVEGGAPTMLFDEVDAGVGGAAALALARALRDVAATRQVLVVTHLPQVAAFADRQVAVRKRVDSAGRSVTTAEVLGPDARVVELSRMLSGHPDSATARAHAQELLGVGRASTTSHPLSD